MQSIQELCLPFYFDFSLPNGCMVGQLVDLLIIWLASKQVSWLVSYMYIHIFYWLGNWFAGLCVEQLVAGWLVA